MPPRKKVTDPTPLEAVAQLMTERQKYERWLRDLDAKKDSTPVNVFERVHADYMARLDEVVNALKQHTSAMQEHARTLMVRLKELEVSEEELRDELSENELRAQVGELTPAEWELSKKKADRLLAKFKEDQEIVANDLNRIREILSGSTTSTPAAQAPRHSTDFDELEFLKSVVGSTTPSASSTPPQSAPRVSNPQVKAETPKPAGAPAPKPEPAAPQPAAQAAAPAVAAAPAPQPPPEAKPKPSVHETPATALRNSGIMDAPKTLKCAECGAMNYPSEWYCERCGAEMTVV